MQEIFQDACENYYADESSVAPMVLVGATYWTETLPAWPLLPALARGRAMEDHVAPRRHVDEAVDLLPGVTLRDPRGCRRQSRRALPAPARARTGVFDRSATPPSRVDLGGVGASGEREPRPDSGGQPR